MSNCPLRVGPRDARPQVGVVVVLVDAHEPLRCFELGAGQHAQQLPHVVRADFAQGVCEQVSLEVRGLPAHVGDHLVAEALLVLSHAACVDLARDRLEVHRRGDMALRDVGSHLLDLALAGSQAGDRHARRVEPDLLVGSVQQRCSVADDGGEDEVGTERFDLLGDAEVVVPGGIERQIVLGHFVSAALQYQVAHDAVGLVGIDVVRAHHEHAGAVGAAA